MTMKEKDYVFGPLPKKKRAVFHHPLGFDLYDGLAMDLHAMKFAEQCVKAEREACAAICDELESFWSAEKDVALLNGDVALSNASSGEPRAARAIAQAIRARGTA